MIRRTAALFALIAFALAWCVGVWCSHPPLARVQTALVAAAFAATAGACIGVALQKIVLARLAEKWTRLEAQLAEPPEPKDVRRKPTTPIAPRPKATAAPSSVPSPNAATRDAAPPKLAEVAS
jgi:hypothetical protein